VSGVVFPNNAPQGGRVFVDAYGADPTGVADSTAAFVAAQTAGGSAYVLVLGEGTYTLGTSADIGTFGPNQSMVGQGASATKLSYKGNGTCVAVYNSAFSSSAVGGSFAGFTIDGSSAGSSAVGMSWGNLCTGRGNDIAINNFTGASSIGLSFKNGASAWSEASQWTAIDLSGNTVGVQFDTGSFDYSIYQFLIYATAGQDGVRLQNNAALEGCRIEVRGNFVAGSGNTAAVIAVDRGASSGTSRIDGAQMYVNVECDGSTGTGHYTVLLGGGSSSMFTGTGVLQFNDETISFQGVSITGSATFGFGGLVHDHALGKMQNGDAAAFQGATQWNVKGSLTTNTSAQVYTHFADVQAFQLGNGATTLALYEAPNNRARRIELLIAQPASGAAGTITWPSSVYFPGGRPVLSTANGAVDRVRLTYLPSSGNWYGELTGAGYVNSGTAGAVAVIDTTAADIAPNGTRAAGSVGLAADAGHVHPSLMVRSASDNGYLAWNADPAVIPGTFTPTSGTIYVAGILLRNTVTAGHVTTGLVSTAASGVTSGQNFIGVYNSSGTRLAQTGIDSAYGSTFSLVSTAVSAGSLSAGLYWVLWLMNASTMPELARVGGIMGALTNAGLGSATAFTATAGTGQTALPSSFTPSSLSLNSQAPWVALS
jgi:hypothetical protein